MVRFSEWIVGRAAKLEAERWVVQVGVVQARAVALEADMDGLEKDIRNIYFKILFTYIKKYMNCYCSLRFYITVQIKLSFYLFIF